ncbi:MAG: chromosome segregation protein SMC [Candidatus Aminicenantes bacterium]|nr:chromosome segregation protein SMC [Candidatus Aminicenantes bacterium]
MSIYLKKIELHGFKSFPEKTVIKFHQGITALIGPNGCGKSNLVDAILWVLGEQRIKNLRGENNEDLIFTGSSSKKPLGMTEVGAYFTNQDSETYVARRFFRSGEGKYILNEKFCRNKDVQDTLFDLGIGERNYFIFEQGSVEKMINLKPSERRILIEEAAGIAQYLERKKETTGKLIIAQQNLDSLELVLQEKNNRLRELKNQVHFARRYREIKNSKNDFLKALLKKKYLSFKEDFDRQGGKIVEFLNGEAALVKEIAAFDKNLLDLETKRWNLDQNLKKNQQLIFDHNNAMLNGSKEIEKSQQRQDFLKQRIEELQKLIAESHTEIKEIGSQDKTLVAEMAVYNRQLSEQDGCNQGLELAIADLKKEVADRNVQDGHLKKSMFNLQVEISRNRNESAQLEKNLMRLEADIGNREHIIRELETQSQNPEIAQIEKAVAALSQELRLREQEAAVVTAEYKNTQADYEAAEKQLHDAMNEISNLGRQKVKYQEIKQKITGKQGKPFAGKKSDFLQELLVAPKNLHAVLESFYFDELDAPIIVDSESALQPDLRKAFLKRAAAAKLPEAIRQATGFRDFVKNLYELEDKQIKKFFRDGVLVDTLKNGLAIFSQYGVDIVTEQGEVIGTNGVLIKNRERGILEVLDEIKAIDNKIITLNRELAGIKENLELISRQKGEKAERLKKAEDAWLAHKEQSISLHSRLEALKKNRDLSLNRIQITGSEIDGLRIEMKKLSERLSGLEKNKATLDKQNENLEREKEEFDRESGKLLQQINEKEKEKIHHDNTLNLIHEKMNSRKNSLQEIQVRLEKRRQQIHGAEEETKRLEDEIAQCVTKIKETKAVGKNLQKEKSDLEKSLKNDELTLDEVNGQAKKISADLTAKRKALEAWRENKKESEISLAAIKKDLFQLEEIANQELGMELKDIEADATLLQGKTAELDTQLNDMVNKLNRMRESDRLNFSAEAEYDILEKDFNFLQTQKDDIVKSILDMNTAITRIDDESRSSFLKAFEAIKGNFVRNFKILFEGGEGELLLTDNNNVLETGLEIQVQPPGKRLQSMRLLSGGEKTLTSLAFLFALFEYKPSPFCVFDEVDASLDEANIQRFLKFLHQLKKKTQFVIITHNFKTMEEADYIYGISMDEPGVSKLYSMKMN